MPSQKTAPPVQKPSPSPGYILGFLSAMDKVPLHGKIDGKSTDRTMQLLVELHLRREDARRGDPVALIIDSPGGSTDAAWQLYDFIRGCLPMPIDAVIVGAASSSAALIVQACRQRLALPNARMLIHCIESTRPVRFDVEHLRRSMKDYQTHAEGEAARWKQAYLDRGVTARNFEDALRRGEHGHISLHASEMLKFGFIDGIVEKFPLFAPYKPPTPTRKRRP